jgi:hypothetical protein
MEPVDRWAAYQTSHREIKSSPHHQEGQGTLLPRADALRAITAQRLDLLSHPNIGVFSMRPSALRTYPTATR